MKALPLVLRGRYTCDVVLVRGEVNTLLIATDLADGTMVVVKTANEPCDDVTCHSSACYCLTSEFAILRRLHRHGAGVPTPIDLLHADGYACLVLERIPGPSLATLAAARRLSIEHVLCALDDIITIVAIAHQLGLAHQDITPTNILLPPRGPAMLIDWGAAARLRPYVERSRYIAFTPGYASPEQRLGHVLAANDVYALGRTLAALGQGADARIEAIIERATAPLGRRYHSVAAFRADLRRVGGGESLARSGVAGPSHP
jgi:eukaryotic-like serine/threonine-protein kinase